MEKSKFMKIIDKICLLEVTADKLEHKEIFIEDIDSSIRHELNIKPGKHSRFESMDMIGSAIDFYKRFLYNTSVKNTTTMLGNNNNSPRNIAELNLQIHIVPDKDGSLRIDCHEGIETVFPIATSTCISIEENWHTFTHTLYDLIEERLEDLLPEYNLKELKVKSKGEKH